MRDRYYSFANAQKLADDLEALLRSRGISIASGSVLEDAILSICEIADLRCKIGTHVPADRERRVLQDLVSVADLAQKLLSVRRHRDFEKLLPHLAKLNTGNPVHARQAKYTDQDSRKLFELALAALAMRIGHGLLMDDPDESSGDNPDIIVSIDSVRWGFACKVPHSRTPKSLYDNLVKGVAQIESSESEIGAVILGIRDIIDREKYWPIDAFGCVQIIQNPEDAIRLLKSETLSLWEEIQLSEDVDPQCLLDLFGSPKSINGFATYALVAAATVKDQRPTPTSLACIGVAQCLKVSDDHCRILARLNKAAQWGS